MDSLPEELLACVCWNLGPGPTKRPDRESPRPCDHRTLYSLMRTSKAFYRAARPVLYHTLDVGFWNQTQISLDRLLDNCIKYPDTPNLIKELRLGTWTADVSQSGHASIPDLDTNSLDMDAVLAATEKIVVSPTLRADIRDGLRRGIADAVIALLLGLCLQLTSLEAQPVEFKGTLALRLVDDTLAQAATMEDGSRCAADPKRRPLQLLQTFYRQHYDTELGIIITDFLPFLQLPSLKAFIGGSVYSGQDVTPSPFAFVTSLQRVSLSNAEIYPTDLEDLLIACPDLRDLELEFSAGTYDSFTPNFHAFGEVLRRHGSRIQHLDIAECDWYYEPDAEDHILGDLTAMKGLRTLHATGSVLFGQDQSSHAAPSDYLLNTLPGSLTEFHMAGKSFCDEFQPFLDAQLQAMMQGEKFRHLARITAVRKAPFSLQVPSGWHLSDAVVTTTNSRFVNEPVGTVMHHPGTMELRRSVDSRSPATGNSSSTSFDP